MPSSASTRIRRAAASGRRGSALVLVLMLTVAIVALVSSAMYLTAGSTILSKQYDRERDFRYASEAALQMGKSYLNNFAYAIPDTGYSQIMTDQPIMGADNIPIPGVTVNMYLGQTGSTTGQFGRFASLVSEARDGSGARYVRRLELAQESFAKFAYWSNRESNGFTTIVFGGGDNLWGPVWSNDDLTIHSTGARFHDDVGTAGSIAGVNFGTFDKGYVTNQKPIALPANNVLTKLAGYANAGNFSLSAPVGVGASGVRMRIEFVATDLDDADTDSTGTGEGFFRVYLAQGGQQQWLRGDYRSENCGDWHLVNGVPKFFPDAVHSTSNAYDWFGDILTSNSGDNMSNSQANSHRGKSMSSIMASPNARCYLGGDPHLVAVERKGIGAASDYQKGGDDTTFTANGNNGQWIAWPGAVQASVAAARPWDKDYLYPIYRGFNPGTQGVIHVNGTVGVSGVLRGSVTLYALGDVIFLDDLKYANDPSLGRCRRDMLGLITKRDAIVADNGINTPQNTSSGYRSLDETLDLFIHGVIMSLNTSFTVENYDSGPTSSSSASCGGAGRGCLYLTGGLIQEARGPVGLTSGQGYTKRYSYDRCALYNPPPYFPTTGRFVDNRYYEIDPVSFTVDELFQRLMLPAP
jgi:hypothetical protein